MYSYIAFEIDRLEIPWELLHKELPRGLTDIRPDCGLLEDGRAFAAIHNNRDRYFLFSCKNSYIYHFLSHYLKIARSHGYEGPPRRFISVRTIARYPRMQAVSATVEEIRKIADMLPNVIVTPFQPPLVYFY